MTSNNFLTVNKTQCCHGDHFSLVMISKDIQNLTICYYDYKQPEALKSLYRSPGYKKNQLVLCKNYVLQW